MQGSDLMSWVASLLGLVAFLRSVLPAHYIQFLDGYLVQFSLTTEVVVSEFEGTKKNELYKHVHTYLGSVAFDGALKSSAFLGKNTKGFSYHPAPDQSVRDVFQGVSMEWKFGNAEKKGGSPSLTRRGETNSESRWYTLRLSRVHKHRLMEEYLQHVVKTAKKLNRGNRELRLYSNRSQYRDPYWDHTPFQHPASFDTIALEPELKQSIIQDLENFCSSGDFFRSIGRAWKRGYLLYGPPGTGKTSIVAAMANFLHFDVYDLELTQVKSNSELRTLLLETTSKSIIVIEDIDCSLDLAGSRNKKKKKKGEEDEDPDDESEDESRSPFKETNETTLSGLLNFTDGLWSSTENERIFVFTTNFVDKLDPALLRSGRMDMHINLGFCSFTAFKILVGMYMRREFEAERYPEMEDLFGEVEISPSDVAETLMRNRLDMDSAMKKLLENLRDRKANLHSASERQEDGDAKDNDDKGITKLLTTGNEGVEAGTPVTGDIKG